MDYGYRNLANNTPEQQAEKAASAPPFSAVWLPFADFLWGHRWLLAIFTLCGAVLFSLISLAIPNRYQSSVELMPPDPTHSILTTMLGTREASGVGVASSILGVRSPNAPFFGMLDSRTAQDDIIDRFDLRHIYKVKTMDQARQVLTKCTTISEDKVSMNLSVVVVDKSPTRARDIAAAYVDELNKLVSAESTSSARTERVFLENQLASLKKAMDVDSHDLATFSSRNVAFDSATQMTATLDSVAKVQEDLSLAESELSAARAIYSDDNSHVRSLKARVDQLEKQMEQARGQQLGQATSLAPDQIFPTVRQLPLLGETYADLYRRVKTDETVYDLLTRQYELAKVEEAMAIPTVKVLDPPNLPERKYFPPRTLITVLGALVSFMFGLVWIAGRAWYLSGAGSPARDFVDRVSRDIAKDLK